LALTSSDDLLVDEATLDTIQGDGSLFTVLAVQLDHDVDVDDTLFQTIIGTFTLTEFSGAYSVDIRWSREWDTELGATMTLYADEIVRVYRLAV
jgi:hypothetical protein